MARLKAAAKKKLMRLSTELTSITSEWDAVEGGFDWASIEHGLVSPPPAHEIIAKEWVELTEVSMVLRSEMRSFASAWAEVLINARRIFLVEFSAWAVRVVDLLGIEKFPTDSADPKPFDLPATGSDSLAQIATGSSDTNIAGLTLILWAAAHRDSHLCRRDTAHRSQVWRWIGVLLNYGAQTCGTAREPFQWVRRAFDNLLASEGIGLTRTKSQNKLDAANIEVRALLRSPKYRTLRAIASKIGCSTGLVHETPAWREFMEARKKVKKPKAVRFTKGVELNVGNNDPELQRLIEEQDSDYEPSPLDGEGSMPKRRAQV